MALHTYVSHIGTHAYKIIEHIILYIVSDHNMFNYILITASVFQDQGVMIAAANQDLWQGGAACGKYFQVTCTGATNQGIPHPCTDNPTVTVMITDFCPPPGCKGDLDLSHEAFCTIADPRAGGIKISYEEYVINYLFFISFIF
ncbi:putative EG45-like domain containing protein, plant [Helianthus debilis subsp. tardiflorus]